MTSYIYDDSEVKLTGREATKQDGPGAARRTAPRGHVDVKVEITPLDNSTGTWKKWVKQDDLYIITEQSDDD